SERPRQANQSGGAGAIIVRAVVNSIGRSVQRALNIAQMIVMSSECDVRILQLWVAAFDDTDNIASELRADDLIVGGDIECELHTLQSECFQAFPACAPGPNLVVFHI